MSFRMTVRQLLDGSKDVTRRLGWEFLKPGDRVCAVRKAMGLRKGERVDKLAVLEVVDVSREPLVSITTLDVQREGYPELSANEFIAKFEAAMGCDENDLVTRIEFRVVEYLAR